MSSFYLRCNELRKTGKAEQNAIEYHFVNTDNNTPARIRITLGDTDPLTGKPIQDISFFREYHAFSNRQAACNDKNIKAPFTKKEKAVRDELRSSIASAFEQEYGYKPSEYALQYLLEEQWPIPYILPIDNLDDDDEDFSDTDTDLTDRYAEEALPGMESDDTLALRAFARTLSGRLLDVYEMMLIRIDAGSEQPQLLELARKWAVSPAQITKDQARIRSMIREYSERVWRFSYDRR